MMNKKFKLHLFKIEMFCNINVFNLTFDQFNASLLSKNVFLSKIKPKSYWSQTFTDPKHWYDMIKYFRVYLCLKDKK